MEIDAFSKASHVAEVVKKIIQEELEEEVRGKCN